MTDRVVAPGSEWIKDGVTYLVLRPDTPAPPYTIPCLVIRGPGSGSVRYLAPSTFDTLAKLSNGASA